jgi:hypothetical protein
MTPGTSTASSTCGTTIYAGWSGYSGGATTGSTAVVYPGWSSPTANWVTCFPVKAKRTKPHPAVVASQETWRIPRKTKITKVRPRGRGLSGPYMDAPRRSCYRGRRTR